MKAKDGFKPWNWGDKVWTDFKPNKGARGYQGTHQHKDYNGNRHGQFQVFWSDVVINKEGWYWISINYKNGAAIGPFESSYMAYHDAVEMEPVKDIQA